MKHPSKAMACDAFGEDESVQGTSSISIWFPIKAIVRKAKCRQIDRFQTGLSFESKNNPSLIEISSELPVQTAPVVPNVPQSEFAVEAEVAVNCSELS
jgi:hypothetical protein